MTQKPQDSEIVLHEGGGISLKGEDATRLYQVVTLRSAISLYMKSGMIPTRGFTISRMLELASKYTGKKYKRNSRAEWAKAIEDLNVWIETMKTALPITNNRRNENES
jgi:hypothetical protein